MPKMTVADGAADLDANHPERAILEATHFLFIDGIIKARPAAPGFVFCSGVKELRLAAAAAVDARPFLIEVGAGEGALGPLLPEDAIFIRRQDGAPFFF